jgi:hypothetical protein
MRNEFGYFIGLLIVVIAVIVKMSSEPRDCIPRDVGRHNVTVCE